MLTREEERREALMEIMAQSDPEDLPPRTHRLTCEGESDSGYLNLQLAMAYVGHRRHSRIRETEE